MADKVSFTVLKKDGTWGLLFTSQTDKPASPPVGEEIRVTTKGGQVRKVVVGEIVARWNDDRSMATRIEGSTSRPNKRRFRTPPRQQNRTEQEPERFTAIGFRLGEVDGVSVLYVTTEPNRPNVEIWMAPEREEELVQAVFVEDE